MVLPDTCAKFGRDSKAVQLVIWLKSSYFHNNSWVRCVFGNVWCKRLLCRLCQFYALKKSLPCTPKKILAWKIVFHTLSKAASLCVSPWLIRWSVGIFLICPYLVGQMGEALVGQWVGAGGDSGCLTPSLAEPAAASRSSWRPPASSWLEEERHLCAEHHQPGVPPVRGRRWPAPRPLPRPARPPCEGEDDGRWQRETSVRRRFFVNHWTNNRHYFDAYFIFISGVVSHLEYQRNYNFQTTRYLAHTILFSRQPLLQAVFTNGTLKY